jgi:hydrogenase maturation factor
MCLGTVGVVVEVWDENGIPMANVETASAHTQRVCLVAHPGSAEGARVLVHSGFVVQVLDPQAAADAVALRAVADGEEGPT